MQRITIDAAVTQAVRDRAPIVALESAVVTAGLPRAAVPEASRLGLDGWRADQPCNLEAARAMQRAVLEHGATPATIAVLDGTLRIGLSADDLERLAGDASAGKASVTNLASTLDGSRASAGTTVSATLAACALSDPPIRVFATGGIGGVHRGWQHALDVSADLHALAKSPVAVVCSGAKAILDLPATMEALEALGVPVVGYGTDWLPQFQCRGDEPSNPHRWRLTQRADDVQRLASICGTHWGPLRQSSAVLVVNPAPKEWAMDPGELEHAVAEAEAEALRAGVIGAERTPFLLARIAQATRHRSLLANLSLLHANAALAADLAVELHHVL